MDYITKFFEDFSANFDSFCEKYFVKLLICVGVILVFLALKFILTAVARRIIKKASHKKSGSAERIDYIYGIILPPVRILTVTAALAVCFLVLGLQGKAYTIGLDAIISLLLFAIFRGLYGFCDYIKYLVLRGYEKKGQKPYALAADYISVISKICVVIIGALTVLQQWDINLTSLLAGLSIGGVALALAAQTTASDLFGAFSVMFERPFEVGDYIEVNGVFGAVEKMGMRSTQIRQINHALVYVPNSRLSSENITNWKLLSNWRVETTKSVLYSTPPDTLRKFIEGLRKMLDDNVNVNNDTALVTFTQFADSSLNIEMRYYVDATDINTMNYEREKVNFGVLELAASLGVGFAFPSRSVYIENNSDKK